MLVELYRQLINGRSRADKFFDRIVKNFNYLLPISVKTVAASNNLVENTLQTISNYVSSSKKCPNLIKIDQ